MGTMEGTGGGGDGKGDEMINFIGGIML